MTRLHDESTKIATGIHTVIERQQVPLTCALVGDDEDVALVLRYDHVTHVLVAHELALVGFLIKNDDLGTFPILN